MPRVCTGCFDETLLSGFLDRVITARERQIVRTHLVACVGCRMLLSELGEIRQAGLTTRFRLVDSHLPASESMISVQKALERLREGNRRFVSGTRSPHPGHLRRAELARKQEPLAIILGCSDSRVPPEIVFDQEVGDLFVIRVAGNIVAPSQVGSVEFAAAQFGTRLVVVLGHSRCAVVLATLEELRQPTENQSFNLQSIVERVRPSVEELLRSELRADPAALVRDAVRANIGVSVNHLRHGSKILEQLIQDEGLMVVGAEYSLETGVIEFFDDAEAVSGKDGC